ELGVAEGVVAGGGRPDRGVVDDAPCPPGRENARRCADAADRDRLGDREGAESTRIQRVDLAAGGGLRDRARERLAGRRAAARVRVAPHAGDPRSRRLCVGERAAEEETPDESNGGTGTVKLHTPPENTSCATSAHIGGQGPDMKRLIVREAKRRRG